MELKKRFRKLKMKMGKGFTIMMVPNSGESIKSFRLPFSIMLIILIMIGFNTYTFFGYIVQVWRIDQFNNILKSQKLQISNLLQDQQKLQPAIKKSYQIFMELNRLRQERLKLLELWKELQRKNGRSSFPVSRNSVITYNGFNPINITMGNNDSTDPTAITQDLNQMQGWMEIESKAQQQLINDLVQFKQQFEDRPFLNPIYISRVTSWFGKRVHPKLGYSRLHTGIDLRARKGTLVLATAAGRVSFAGYKHGYGYTVIINHGQGYQTLYAHNSKVMVTKGTRVVGGKPICLSGNTGTSTGPHLHYEVRINGKPVNPIWFLKN